jgi:hypothetical protein
LKFVKAKHTALLCNIGSHEWNGVTVISVFHLQDVRPLVDVLHKVVEVNSSLGGNIARESLEEHVHQHCLSAPNVSVEVQPFGKVVWNLGRSSSLLGVKDGAQERRGFGFQGLDIRVDDCWRFVCQELFVEML